MASAATLESVGVRLTLVKRNGKDGASIPGAALQPRACLFGRADDVDVKILLNTVAPHQCRLLMDDNDDLFVEPIADGGTYLNGAALTERLPVSAMVSCPLSYSLFLSLSFFLSLSLSLSLAFSFFLVFLA